MIHQLQTKRVPVPISDLEREEAWHRRLRRMRIEPSELSKSKLERLRAETRAAREKNQEATQC